MAEPHRPSFRRDFIKAATGIATGAGLAAAAHYGEGTDGMVSIVLGTATGLMAYAAYDPCAAYVGRFRSIPEFFKRHF